MTDTPADTEPQTEYTERKRPKREAVIEYWATHTVRLSTAILSAALREGIETGCRE